MSTIPKDQNALVRIYVLKDPNTMEIRYVGKTIQSLHTRLSQHMYDLTRALKNKEVLNHRLYWLKKLQDGGQLPIIEQIDTCAWKQSQEKEIFWIAYYKKSANLVNSTDGGEGNLGGIKTPEAIAKLKKSLRSNTPKVYQYSLSGEFIQEWNSPAEAAEQLGLKNASGITRCLRKERLKYKDCLWITSKNDLPELLKKINTPKDIRNKKKGYALSDLSKLVRFDMILNDQQKIYLLNDLKEFLGSFYNTQHLLTYLVETDGWENSIQNYNKINTHCRTKTSYLNYYFTKEYNPKYTLLPKVYIFLFSFNLNGVSYQFNGIKAFADYFNIKSANIINFIKGVTKSISINSTKVIPNIIQNEEFCRLYMKMYR